VSWRAVVLVAGVLALASCRSPFTNVWEDPGWQGEPLRKVLVIGKQVDAATRRAYEDALSAQLFAIGIQAEPSHRSVPDDSLGPEAIERALAAGGHDGLIAARLIGVDERARYLPGVQRSPAGRGSAAGWRSWHGFSQPGTWRVDRIARIETQVWSLAGESQLIWAGSSETVNPRDVPGVARRLAEQTVSTLQRAGILPAE
jgi:hypothetical protein